MNIKYVLIIAITITIIMFLFTIYKIMCLKDQDVTQRYPLRRRNALTEEEFNKILEEINKKKHLN